MTSCHDELTHPALVAHRGYALRYPENTVVSIRAALEAGARAVEVDVQLTADHVPVLLHDASLKRTAGIDQEIFDLPLARARTIAVGETDRLGDAFAVVTLPTLADAVAQIGAWPQVMAFVELKRASLRRFGNECVVGRVLKDLEPIIDRVVVISFDKDAVGLVRDQASTRIGWVIEAGNDDVRAQAERLAPDYLFCNWPLLPGTPWPGPWRWVVYGVETPQVAAEVTARGVKIIETMSVGELLGG